MMSLWLLVVAPLLLLSSSSSQVFVLAQDITPLPANVIIDEAVGEGLSYVDTTLLPEGNSFYGYETLSIQLWKDGPVWTIRNTFKADNYFAGESDDKTVALSLMRYTSENTGLTVVTGVAHDRRENKFYEIRPDAKGRDTVRGTLEDDMYPLGEPQQPSFFQRMFTFDGSTPVASTWYHRIHNFLDTTVGLGGTFRNDPGPTYLDVLIIWSESSECYISGLSTGCSRTSTTQTNMEAAVELMIAETNFALTNSHTGAQVILAHRQVDSSGYRETSMSNTLRQITNIDGTMDYIHSLRNERKADLVQFIVDNRVDSDGLGGIAWLPQSNMFGCYNSALGFSAICAQCMTNYISAHEFGHNLNCLHDRGTANNCVGDCYMGGRNYGYRSPSSNFRSIMAYQCRSGQCDNNPGGSCPRIGYYSGNVDYNGEHVGRSDNNCAGEITAMMRHIHAYR